MPSGKVSIWFATTNRHKFREAKAVLAELGVRVRELRTSKVELQHNGLETIALFAAKSLPTRKTGVIVVEDSGLFISKLHGFPGPYSSFTFKTIGTEGILRLLRGSRKREANFQSVVAARLPNGQCKTFKGIVRGSISEQAAGSSGFGFDPIFVPRGMTSTFAQLGQEPKNRTSHRARAFRSLAKWVNSLDH